MRSVFGEIVLPPDTPATTARVVHVEVRDVTVADAPSTVVASRELHDVAVAPGARLPFAVDVPDVASQRRLNVRVHIDVTGSGSVSSGDYLTTESIVVPSTGPSGPIAAPVRRV